MCLEKLENKIWFCKVIDKNNNNDNIMNINDNNNNNIDTNDAYDKYNLVRVSLGWFG